jgi:hypothetical protein
LNGIQQVSERGQNAKWFDAERTIWQLYCLYLLLKTASCHLMTVSQILMLSGIIIIQRGRGGMCPFLRGRNINCSPVNVRFEALTAGNIKVTVWLVWWVGTSFFGGIRCLHLQGGTSRALPHAFTLVPCSAHSILKMEVICSSETLVDFQRATRRYISGS